MTKKKRLNRRTMPLMLACLMLALQLVAGSPSSPPTSALGATPGGVSAAVAATREGARVALLEPGLYVGGMMSGGLRKSAYGAHAQRVMGGCIPLHRVLQTRGGTHHALLAAQLSVRRLQPPVSLSSQAIQPLLVIH